MSLLSDADRDLLAAVAFDPDAEPAFNEITWCLVWPDEVPDGLSREGYRVVRDLLAVRRRREVAAAGQQHGVRERQPPLDVLGGHGAAGGPRMDGHGLATSEQHGLGEGARRDERAVAQG